MKWEQYDDNSFALDIVENVICIRARVWYIRGKFAMGDGWYYRFLNITGYHGEYRTAEEAMTTCEKRIADDVEKLLGAIKE